MQTTTTTQMSDHSILAAQPGSQGAAQFSGDGESHTSAADFLQIESIVLNLDASLRVHARAHFFSWTQGLLHSLIRHELLVCGLCHGKPPVFRADGFSMTTPEPSVFSDAFLRDNSVAPALLKAWEERRYQPVVFECGPGAAGNLIGNGGFAREIERLGATQLLVHGLADSDGRALSLFVFACRPGSIGARQSYVSQLVVPAMHAAWMRTQAQRPQGSADKPSGHGVLTVRELDIL